MPGTNRQDDGRCGGQSRDLEARCVGCLGCVGRGVGRRGDRAGIIGTGGSASLVWSYRRPTSRSSSLNERAVDGLFGTCCCASAEFLPYAPWSAWVRAVNGATPNILTLVRRRTISMSTLFLYLRVQRDTVLFFQRPGIPREQNHQCRATLSDADAQCNCNRNPPRCPVPKFQISVSVGLCAVYSILFSSRSSSRLSQCPNMSSTMQNGKPVGLLRSIRAWVYACV